MKNSPAASSAVHSASQPSASSAGTRPEPTTKSRMNRAMPCAYVFGWNEASRIGTTSRRTTASPASAASAAPRQPDRGEAVAAGQGGGQHRGAQVEAVEAPAGTDREGQLAGHEPR